MPAQLRWTVPDKSGCVSPRRLDCRHVRRRVKRAICRAAADGEGRPTACRIYRAMSSEFEVSAAEPSAAEFATQLPTVVVAGVPLSYIERCYPLRNPIPTMSSFARPTPALAKSMLNLLRPPSGRSAAEGCLRQRGRRVFDDRSAGFAQCDRPRRCRTHDRALSESFVDRLSALSGNPVDSARPAHGLSVSASVRDVCDRQPTRHRRARRSSRRPPLASVGTVVQPSDSTT